MNFRRLSAGVVLAAAAAILTFSSAFSAPGVQIVSDFRWTLNGAPDSSARTLNGAVQQVDTLVAIDISRYDKLSPSQAVNTTAYGIGTIVVTAATVANTDSMFLAYDVSYDGGKTFPGSSAFVGYAVANANDKVLTIPLQVDSDAAWSAAGGLWSVPWVRFRLRSDGNTAALCTGVHLSISHWEYNR